MSRQDRAVIAPAEKPPESLLAAVEPEAVLPSASMVDPRIRAARLETIAALGSPFALKVDKSTGKVIEHEPAAGSVKAWGLAKRWPQWLVEAMATRRLANEVLTESDAEDLALEIAGLPLGPQKVKA